MRTITQITVFLFVGAIVGCSSGQNTKDGFRGYKWGTHISDFPDSLFDSSSVAILELDFSLLKVNISQLGGVELTDSTLVFFYLDKEFSMVAGEVNSTTDEDRFKAVLIEVYGEPTTTSMGRDSTSGLSESFAELYEVFSFIDTSSEWYAWEGKKTLVWYGGRGFYIMSPTFPKQMMKFKNESPEDRQKRYLDKAKDEF